jgi:hypothetical protein
MLQVLVNVSLERFQLQKKRHGLCKSYSYKKRERRKSYKKWINIRDMKTMGTSMPAMKKEER